MTRVLYISDLDGTLLNQKKEVSLKSSELLNTLIKKGVHFSIATARTPATAEDILRGIDINLPVVLMNGSVIYNLKKHEYIHVEYIHKAAAERILQCLGRNNEESFIYTISENQLVVHHQAFKNNFQVIFYNERKDKPQKRFTKDPLTDCSKVVYFTFTNHYERINELYQLLKPLKDLAFSMYRDVYNEGAYFLEVYSDKATKANAVKTIKETYKYDKIISFGDNLNDLSLFKVSDQCYAVSNAQPELKQIATGIIGANDADSVAEFIALNSVSNKI